MATAVVMTVTAVPVLVAGEASAQTSPVSGSFAMGGGSMGEVDPRKGVFRTSLPLLALQGRGGLDVSVSLAYDQQAAAAEQNRGAGRAGLGAGWSYSLPAVAAEGGLRVLPASGGSYEADEDEATGLARYPLEDLEFEKKPGTMPARDGTGERAYSYLLRYDDGRTDYFDASGDLSVRTDRFGNRIDFGWDVPPDGQTHRLAWAVDSYGQKTVLEHAPDGSVTVISPKRSDSKVPEMKLTLTEGRLTSLTDTAKQTTTFHYENPDQPALLTRASSPTGAQTVVTYKPVDYMPGLTVVDSVKVTDDSGANTLSERRFSMDVDGGDRRNYTGFPQYHDKGGNALFDADDKDAAEYTYTTELSDGKSTVRSTFNKLHLLTKQEVKLKAPGGEEVTVQTQEMHYEGEKDGIPPRADDLPANYSKPVEATMTHIDPASGTRRTSTETARFDGHGRQVERTDATGAKTVTEYDGRFGLPLKSTTTGSDGAVSVSENKLSGDGKTVVESSSLTGNKDQQPSARTVTATKTDQHGEVTEVTTRWAQGARPEGDQGPEQTTDTRTSEIDTARHTRTETLTSPAGTTREVSDLTTGAVIAVTDAAGRTITTAYDEGGRPVRHSAPGAPAAGEDTPPELVTTIKYLTPTTTEVTTPDGHVTVETVDLLGRPVKSTDNVRDGEFTDDPAARTLKSVEYLDEGLTAKVTDGAGLVTVTTSDALGRPVRTVAPNGVTQLTAYNDAATASTSTKTTATLKAGETDPAKAAAVTTETYDSAGRSAASADSYADKTPAAPTSQSFDGLGRIKESVAGDVATVPSYDGPGGTVQQTTLTPKSPDAFPGEEITAHAKSDLTGAGTVKTLTPGSGEGRSGSTLVRDDAGRVISETGQDGGKTAYTYTPAGQVKESVSPTGVKTVFTYEKNTGRVSETAVTSADGTTTEKTAYTYDAKTGQTTEVYDPADKAGTLISYTYNADSNVLQVAYPDGKTLSQTFDNNGQRTSLTDTAGSTTRYVYNDKDGTLKEAVQHGKDGQETGRVRYVYDGLGQISQVVRGGTGDGKGVTTDYTYTGAKQIKTEKTTRPDGSVVTEAAYEYDSHGNLTRRSDHRPQAKDDGSPGPMVKTTTGYRYDAYDRLLSSEVRDQAGTLLSSAAYAVNVSGDVTQTETTDRNGKKTVTGHTIDPAGRLTAVTVDGRTTGQAWDKEGNLLTDFRGNTYTYDSRNRPLTVTTPDGSKTSYTYWANGTRATASTDSRSGDSGTTRFYYSPKGHIINDAHTGAAGSGNTGETTASYLLGVTREARTLTGTGAPEAAGTGGGYLLHDRHGNTTALTTADGAVNAAWHYTDYGQAADHTGTPTTPAASRGSASNPFTYAGEYTNPGTGTQHLQARTYDPAQNRFIQKDPENLHNRYQAMGTNPITYVDPTGNSPAADWAAFGVTAAITLAAIIATIFFPPATALLAAMTIGGFAADTVGLGMQLVALADDAAKFLSKETRDGLFWAGVGVGIAGAVTAIGSSIATAVRTSARAAQPTWSALTSKSDLNELAAAVYHQQQQRAAIARAYAQMNGKYVTHGFDIRIHRFIDPDGLVSASDGILKNSAQLIDMAPKEQVLDHIQRTAVTYGKNIEWTGSNQDQTQLMRAIYGHAALDIVEQNSKATNKYTALMGKNLERARGQLEEMRSGHWTMLKGENGTPTFTLTNEGHTVVGVQTDLAAKHIFKRPEAGTKAYEAAKAWQDVMMADH